MADTLHPFTIIYTERHSCILWQGFRCMAEDSEHAEEQFLNAHPDADIVWINAGYTDLVPVEH